MPVFDLFSRKKREADRKALDVFCYDNIPHPLRIQLLHALDDARQRICDRTVPAYIAIGTEGTDIFAEACLVLRRELGMGRLVEIRRRVRSMKDTRTRDLCDEFTVFFENCETEQVLDSVQIVMALIEKGDRHRLLDDECNASTVAGEINQRFLEHGIGYQYQSGQIIVQTNSLLHSEAVTPALTLLSDPRFAGANEEFLKAYEHYRHSRLTECLVDCLKAFESSMKIICDVKGWPYKPTDTAKPLIEICLSNNLVPTFTQQQLTSLRTLLESGVPTVRNKKAGHGQGANRQQVAPQLARFGLHLTAAVVVLLVESFNETQP
ncbi:MAG: hypothetical protein KF777_11005 [Planctomycetaceae bacterium]|nr:hypothetical protein [Planctomycetaceae bacterium]